MNNHGIAVIRFMMGLVALFSLTVIFVYMDPVVEDNIHAEMKEIATDSKADAIIDTYLTSWHNWVALFLAAIFIYVVSAGGSSDKEMT